MRRHIIAVLLCTLLINTLPAQDTTGTIDEKFLDCVVKISIPTPKGFATGTGFLISYKTSKEGSKVLLITNKHVIGAYSLVDPFIPRDSIIVHLYTKDRKTSHPIPVRLTFDDGQLRSLVQLHPDPKIDIAAINISKAFNLNPTLYYSAPDTTYLYSLKRLPSIKLGFGSQVFAIGYPAGLVGGNTNQAIAKAGYIASSIKGDLQIDNVVINRRNDTVITKATGKYFLVDGLIIGGNSGGPVVSPKDVRFKILNDGLEYVRGLPNVIIGIVSSGIPGTGISTIYSSDHILEVVKMF